MLFLNCKNNVWMLALAVWRTVEFWLRSVALHLILVMVMYLSTLALLSEY